MVNITANKVQFHLFLRHKHRHTIQYLFREKNERRCNTIMLMLRMREFADRKLKMHKKMRGPGVSDLEESWHFMASNSATFCIGLRQKLVVQCLIMILNIFYFIMQ